MPKKNLKLLVFMISLSIFVVIGCTEKQKEAPYPKIEPVELRKNISKYDNKTIIITGILQVSPRNWYGAIAIDYFISSNWTSVAFPLNDINNTIFNFEENEIPTVMKELKELNLSIGEDFRHAEEIRQVRDNYAKKMEVEVTGTVKSTIRHLVWDVVCACTRNESGVEICTCSPPPPYSKDVQEYYLEVMDIRKKN